MRSHELAGGGSTASVTPFHLLEVTIISAQNLKRATPSMRTYATAYVNPAHKVHTRVDPAGGADPTWNDRFIFRVDEAFLRSETATVTINIWAARRRRKDIHLGTVNIIVSASASTRGSVAFLVRRPRTLRPQGILNVGIARIDPGSNTVPHLYSAVGATAFAHNDLVLGSFKTRVSAASELGAGEESPQPQAMLERKGSVEVGGWVMEKELKDLESKLKQWRTELPPLATGSGGRKKSKLTWCFCGGRKAMGVYS